MSQNDFFQRHQATLDQALNAIKSRDYWSPYPENPSPRVYGEDAAQKGEEAFKACLNNYFELEMPGITGEVAGEESPYGIDMNVRYPQVDFDVLIPEMKAAMKSWRDAGPDVRAGVCLEILDRLNKNSFEIANGVMHTSGQGFMMAFQAGGPHAQDRGLEAVAYAYRAMKEVPETATWTKPQGKHDPLVMEKKFHVVPRGVALVVGCSTFPTWNTYPGLFASLVTGNPVIVKPHPASVLPAATSIKIAQQVLKEAGFAPYLVSMVTDTADAPVTKELATHKDIKLIDFTGSNFFGNWLEENAKQAQVFTEKAGVNTVVIDSVNDIKAVARNLAFTLSLYSGQMCTTTQAIYIPRDGIKTADGEMSFDDVAQALSIATSKFLGDNDRACMVLGAIQSCATAERIKECEALGEVVLASEQREHPQFPNARIHTPMILKVDASEQDKYSEERFGPISFVIATDSTEHSLQLAQDVISEKGAITLGVYSTDDAVLEQAEEVAMEAGVALSVNLDGGVFVNQSAAFSDFHATGGNPASNASLTDGAFVTRRFIVVQSRRHV